MVTTEQSRPRSWVQFSVEIGKATDSLAQLWRCKGQGLWEFLSFAATCEG